MEPDRYSYRKRMCFGEWSGKWQIVRNGRYATNEPVADCPNEVAAHRVTDALNRAAVEDAKRWTA